MSKFVLLIVLCCFSFSLLAKELCLKGFSSSWSFDQMKRVLAMEEKKASEVCNFSQVELKSNFEIKFFHKNKFVYSKKINWPEETLNDVVEGGNLKAVITKNVDHRVIKFPVTLDLVDKYKVVHLSTGEVWGKGSIK